MSVSTVRRLVVVVCVAGVAGMIASSVAGNNGAALTFGLVTAAAVVCLMVATAVAGTPSSPAHDDADVQAARVEEAVERLVARGADEAEVRALVGEAVRLGRSRAPSR